MDKNTCCWNRQNGGVAHDEDCNTLGPRWGSATMVVTFVNGLIKRYPGVRFPQNTSATDPTRIVGNTVYTETDDAPLTILGVESFTMDH